MRRSHWMAVFLAMTLHMFNAMPVAAFEIGARALYWFPGFKGDVRVDGGGLAGNRINLKDELGIDNKSYPTFEVFGGLGKHNLSLAYTPIDNSGSATLSRQVTFNGQTFGAGANVNSDLRLRMLDLEYQYTLLDMENILAGFSLGAIGKIKYIDGEARISSTGKESSDTFKLPIPMVGVGAHVGLLLDILEARAKATGMAYSDSYLYEGVADLSYTPFPFLDIHAGYKVIRVHYDRDDTFLDAEFTGPYVGLTVSF